MAKKARRSRPKYTPIEVDRGFIVSNGHRQSMGDGKTIGALHVFIQQCLGRPVAEEVTNAARREGLLPVPTLVLNHIVGWGPVECQTIAAALDDPSSMLAQHYSLDAIKCVDTSWFFGKLSLS